MAKLTRKTQKLFSALNPAQLGVFGSAQLAAPATSNDLDVIQSAAYEQGWTDATIGGDKRPPLEEFNGIKYVNDYQNAYQLQEGIAEYDAGTTYFIGSIVKESGTSKIYKSITDDNIGNALMDVAEWQFLQDLVSNTIKISSEADFPDPILGVITLESKNYQYQGLVFRNNKILIPDGVTAVISSVGVGIGIDVYLGVGNGIEALGNGIFTTNRIILSAPSSTAIYSDNEKSCFLTNTIIDGVVTAAEIRSNRCSFVFCAISNFTGTIGIISADRTDAQPRDTFAMELSSITDGADTGATLLDVSGQVISVGIGADTLLFPKATETALNYQQSIKDSISGFILMNGVAINLSLGGSIFAVGSLDQKYINSKFTGNLNVEDSTSSSKTRFEGNSTPTVISVAATNTPIITDTPYEIVSVLLERFLVQDLCILDGALDTINTTFNHGLVNDDRFFLNVYAGSTLPAELDEVTEYFVINANAQDYQLSLTQGGAAIDFTGNGTGTINYRHSTGVSQSGELIYVGNENVKVRPDGWVSIINTINSNDDCQSAIMKINLDGTITEDQVGSLINVNNTRPQSSQISDLLPLVTGEGIVIYVRNNDATNNITVLNILLTLTRT